MSEKTETTGAVPDADGGEMVLCGASSYTKKYYLNPTFQKLPEGVQEDLKIMCVLYTAEASGSIELFFDEEGNLMIRTDHKDEDALYDHISSGLKVKEMQKKYKELFQSLELYYRVVIKKEPVPEDMLEE